ncbi:hypothetical protein [Paraburkholderia fungorum]|jgi:hypothetical protein|uniref:hypothetical protein n=1 Tax=Paraburkholderia fungorum TaxID=134537 RepID=UPI0017B9E93E|nr:hypothetical protein [Paraburkholderia fungorum]MBB5542146.1 hypothetical protein [Paraburkholderia fungorum]
MVDSQLRSLAVEFGQFFRDKEHPKMSERIGVMSIDSLTRQWEPVGEENGYLIARSKDGKAALLGRMGKREDGKFCIEIAIRATIENNRLSAPEFWHVDLTEKHHLYRVMQRLVWTGQAEGDR